MDMAMNSKLLFSIIISISMLLLNSSAQTCSNYTFSANQLFDSCVDLPYLQAHLHWTYIPSTEQIQVAYRATHNSTGWVAWAINPTQTGMVGSQAIMAFRNSNGTITVFPTSITSYTPSMQPGTLSFNVSSLSAEYANNQMTIYALVGPLSNLSSINLVWQSGDLVSDNTPKMHTQSGPNVLSMGKLDFLSGIES